MFTTLNKDDHAKRKRILADRYANSNVMKPASLAGIEERSRKFMQRLRKSVRGHESHDVFVSCATTSTSGSSVQADFDLVDDAPRLCL